MDEIRRVLGTTGRVRSDSLSSDATQSTASKLVLRHRLNQLMTCVDDLDSKTKLHDKVVKTLDNAFLVCGKRANKPKKNSFRWRTNVTSCPFCVLKLGTEFVFLYKSNAPPSPFIQLFSLLLFALKCFSYVLCVQ